MRVVLISLFHYDSFAVRFLFSYLKSKNIPVSCIGFKRMKQKATKTLKNDYVEMHDYHSEITDDDINTLLEQLEKLNPSLIGISLQTTHLQPAKQLTQAIKAKFKVPIIWGGSHPTIDPESCIQHTDIVCVGEGFNALAELSQRISQGKPYDDIKNLWIRSNNEIIRNDSRPLLTNLDILPFASFDSKDKIYIDEGQVQDDKNFDYFGFGFTDNPAKTIHQIMSSFGCPMSCSFCINSLDCDKFRRRSVSHVMKELIEVKQKNPHLKMVFFWDNIFAINKKWCLEFSKEYKREINLPFFTYSHPLCTDMEIFTALREAGWAITVMGIQSGSYDVRKRLYARNETNEKILEAAQKLNKLRSVKSCAKYFRIYYDYVKNNPLEGKKDLAESLDLFLKFPKGFIYQAFNLSFFPNYPITKYFLEKEYISENDIEGKSSTSASNWITTFNSKKQYRGFLRRHEYYYFLFSLAQFKIFPNFLIKIIEKNKLFMKNLRILYWLCIIVRFFDLNFRFSNFCWAWELIRMIPVKLKIKYKTLLRYN